MEAKSEIRLPIFEGCPLTNRPGMVGESTFPENPCPKSALLILSKESMTTHVEIISEKIPKLLESAMVGKGLWRTKPKFLANSAPSAPSWLPHLHLNPPTISQEGNF